MKSKKNRPTVAVQYVCIPDILILVDVDLVKLMRAEFIFQTAHVGNHLQGNKARQDGEHQTLLWGQIWNGS